MPRSHEELDKEVSHFLVQSKEDLGKQPDLDKILCAALLQRIVDESDGLLNMVYKDLIAAGRLVKAHADLKRALLDMWKTRSCKAIRELDILKPSLQIRNEMRAVEAAWDVPYCGDNHLQLLNNINAMNRTLVHSNYVSIIQSSGTGKSRLVHELAKEVFTLPFTLRPINGWFMPHPPPDYQIHNLLRRSPKSFDDAEALFFMFFHHLFSGAAEQLSLLRAPGRTSDSIASDWRDHLMTCRSDFYDTVVQKCLSSNQLDSSESTAIALAKQSLRTLIKLIDSYSVSSTDSSRSVKVMLYFDNADALRIPPLPPYSTTLFAALCSVLAEFCNLPLFCIFLSTDLSLGLRSPPARGSWLAALTYPKMQAPITETPFDCSPDLKIVPGRLRLEDLSTIEFLARWGRPLWWSVLQGASNFKLETVPNTLLDFARRGLLSHPAIDVDLVQASYAIMPAIVDILLLLDSEPRYEFSDRQQRSQVASHMRIVYSIPKDCYSFRSGYPSEPLLAEAALQQMLELQTQVNKGANPVNIMLKTLLDHMKDRQDGRNQHEDGVLVMRFLLMQAYIRSIVAEGHAHFSHGCKLVTFIQQLFTPQYANEILLSHPDNIKSETNFQGQFAKAVVRFTHFVIDADDTAPSTPAIFAAFVRGMAFICREQQDVVDLVIPVLLDSEAPLQESVVSAILIKVTQCVTAMPALSTSIDQREVGLFYFAPDDDIRPYITIVAQLGAQLSLSAPHDSPQITAIHPPKDTHPRYHLTAYGFSDTVYKVIHPSERDQYRKLLAFSDFFSGHGRQDAESLSAVRRMKPFWTVGEDCYHWINDPVLRTQPVGDVDGVVVVGRYEEDYE